MAFTSRGGLLYQEDAWTCPSCFGRISVEHANDSCWMCGLRAHTRACMGWEPLSNPGSGGLPLGYICGGCVREREE